MQWFALSCEFQQEDYHVTPVIGNEDEPFDKSAGSVETCKQLLTAYPSSVFTNDIQTLKHNLLLTLDDSALLS